MISTAAVKHVSYRNCHHEHWTPILCFFYSFLNSILFIVLIELLLLQDINHYYYDDAGWLLGEGSEHDGSNRDQSHNALTSSTSDSSSSSLSESDSDEFMASQELRPGFSADRRAGTGSSRNRGSPNTYSEVDRQHDFTAESNDTDSAAVQWVTFALLWLIVVTFS